MEGSNQQTAGFGTFAVEQIVPALKIEPFTLRIIAASAGLSEALGHAQDVLQEMSMADLLAPQDIADFRKACHDLGREVTAVGVWHLTCSSGASWPADLRGLRDTDAQSLVFILQDATRLVAAERERNDQTDRLREQEANMHAAQRLLDIGIWKMDLDTRQLVWSENVHAIYGAGADSFTGDVNSYVALVHPDDRDEMTARLERFLSSGETEFTFRHRILRPEGQTIHVRGAARTDEQGGRRWLTGVVQDITDEVNARAELRDALRIQRMAGRMARMGGWRVELDPPRVRWSAETATIHEVPEDFAPSLEDAIGFYVPEHRGRIRSRVNACAEAGIPFDEVLQIRTARGNLVWVHAIGEPARNDAGLIVAVEGAFQDITELVAARGSSEGLSRRLQQTLESISDAFYLLDENWRFSFLNSQAEVLLQRSRASLLGTNIWQEFPDAAGSPFQIEYERAVSEDRAVRFQEFYPPLQTWFEVDAYPTPEGLAVYFRDVTQQRERDEHLRLLEAAVSRQNDILLITEAEPIDAPDGPKIVYVNDAFVHRTGYAREEAIGKTPRILQGPKTQRAELDRIRRALEEMRPVRAELINYKKSGEEIWLELDIVPLADETGRFTHMVAIERDITERKQAQQALQANEERFRLVAKATGNAIWDWDITRGRQWWSEGLSEIFGHAPASDEAVPTTWHAHVHPDDAPRVEADFARLEAGLDDGFVHQYRFRRTDGRWVTVEDRAFVVRDADGRATRILGSMTDISERLDLEDRLHQAQKLEAVGQLTGGVAHDFNNLLTVILGNSEILSDELSDQHQLRMLADMTATAAERGAELTNRLLAFSRKQTLQPRVLDVSGLIQGMEALLRRTLPENIDIEIVRAGGLWKIEIDPGQLESAVLNLVLNARDAMPGGGCMTIEMANAALDDDYVSREKDLEAGQYVVIVVTDTGQGIAPETLSRVFEPFFTTKDVGKGSGLGLSMVYGFVKQSGGHIRIYSELGEGTSFKLYFPRAHAQDAPVRFGKAGRTIVGGNETILVVEDDNLVREHLISLLNVLGYRVFGAPSGPRALEILRDAPDIDLLFTDIVMPGGMDGRELADIARALRPELKVLFTSGYTENAIVHNGRLDPGVELLGKPYRRERLAVKVRKVLDRK